MQRMRHMNWLIGSLMLGATLTGCGDPPLSDVASKGGSVSDPAGLIEGTVQYVGPRPLCEYDDKGRATKLRGVGAVLVLYGFNDLRPPDGPTPASALVVPMSSFFANLSDCMPENPTPTDLHKSVTVSASYSWPRIPLGDGLNKRVYRIEAVFDRDGDYYPLLPLSHGIATAGDALGGATLGFGNEYRPIEFAGLCAEEIRDSGEDNGQVVSGVAVTVALPLWTERQMFEVKQNNKRGYLSSEQFIDLGENEIYRSNAGFAIPTPSQAADAAGALENRKLAYLRMREFAGLELTLINGKRASPDCVDPAKPKADGSDKCVATRLNRLHIDYDLLDQKSYAWHLWPYDNNGDGFAEPHPPLSFAFGPPEEEVEDVAARGFAYSVQTPWTFPQIFLSRIKSPEEKLAAVPDAGMLGGVDRFAQEEHSVWYPTLPVNLVPTVAISTKKIDANDDGLNDCDVDVYAPGNFAVAYQVPGRPSDCQELPVGDYSIVTLTGIAGNVVYKKDPRSQTNWNMALPDENEDGEADPFAVAGVGQIWLHPNDLGDPTKYERGFEDSPDLTEAEQVKDFILQSQGVGAAFKIRDPNPKNAARLSLPDADQQPMIGDDGLARVVGDCDMAPVPGPEAKIAKIEFTPIPDECCSEETVALCDLDRCDVKADGSLEPTLLNAWISDKKISLVGMDAADIAKLKKQGVTLADAEERTAKGETVIFRGRFAEALPTEPADLVIPKASYKPGDRQYISYEELMAEDSTIQKATYPECEALRKDAKAAADKPEESKTVRLKVVQLEPTCLPFLIPKGCCE